MRTIKQITHGLTFRMAVGIVLWFLVFNVITSGIGYWSFTDSLTREYNEAALRTATTAQMVIGTDGGDKIDEYLTRLDGQGENFSDAEYGEKWSRLSLLCTSQDATYVYVVKVNTETYAEHISVFNTVNPKNTKYPPRNVGDVNTINDDYKKAFREIYEEGRSDATVLRTDNLSSGSLPHITSLVPIKNSAGEVVAVLCVERPMAELVSGRATYLRNTLLSTIGLIILSVTAIVLFLNKQFVKPTHKIIAEAKRFADENTLNDAFDLGKITDITEIKEMADQLRSMESDTVKYMENLTTVTAERERIDTELALAKRIQANVLPSLFPPFPNKNEFEIFASMTPAKEVGGDFYDFFLLDDDHLGLVMADVSGKGVPAALFMMATKNLIKSYAMLGGTPSEILTRVNKEICKHNTDDMFVTVWFGILEISTGKVIASNAGHEYPAIKRRGGQFELFRDKHGFVVGGMDMTKYKDYEFVLGIGDSLFVYTDGVAEANDKNNTLFGTDRMLAGLNRVSTDAPVDILASVQDAIDLFVGDADQFDDITMMAITMRYLHKDNTISVIPGADGHEFMGNFIRERLDLWQAPRKTRVRMEIAFDEVYSNIQNYSGATDVSLTLIQTEEGIGMRFFDNGTPFDPTKIPTPDTTLSADEREIGGLGMHMVREQTTEMLYEYKDGRNCLTLMFSL